MMKRSLFLTLAAGLLAWGFGALEARAGQIPLPTTLDQLLPDGNFVVLSQPPGTEADTISKFSFSSSAIPMGTPLLDPSQVNVRQFGTPFGPSDGLTFSGAFFAPAGTTVDYEINYTITAPKGFNFTDALLGVVFNVPVGSTGTVSIGESLFDASTGLPLGNALGLSVSSPPGIDLAATVFPPVHSINVVKDIILVGGSLGAGISVVQQGFSSSTIPEPHSLVLLAIGMGGFFTVRRFFKKRIAVA
jgi:hypothetical protein